MNPQLLRQLGIFHVAEINFVPTIRLCSVFGPPDRFIRPIHNLLSATKAILEPSQGFIENKVVIYSKFSVGLQSVTALLLP